MNHETETVVPAPITDELAEIEGESSLAESPAAGSDWKRDIDALCRALDAQQRAHFARTDPAKQ
jgi:hypothetical protein